MDEQLMVSGYCWYWFDATIYFGICVSSSEQM